jgi:hypothetical protein
MNLKKIFKRIKDKFTYLRVYFIQVNNDYGYYLDDPHTIGYELDILENVSNKDKAKFIFDVMTMKINTFLELFDEENSIKIECEKMSKYEYDNLEDFNGW